MSRPWQEYPPHRPSPYQFVAEHPPDIYAGPTEYMEAGARGFLVNTMLGKEEIGIDDAIELLRQAAIKLYGGIKPSVKKFDATKGYVKIDFMDPETVTVLPVPEGEEDEEEEKENDKEQEATKTDEKAEEKESEGDKSGQKVAKAATNEKEPLESKVDNEENVPEKKDESKKSETANDEKKGETKEYQWMRSPYKFKAFRTEIRNLTFIKSNVPDPLTLANAAMEIILARKTVNGDAMRQVLPVLGVCQNDYTQLEKMTIRVLQSIFDESLAPKGFSVFLLDKLSYPGADLLIETVRNAIWSINPAAWQTSPLTEPDVFVRLEIIGRKLVLSCLTHFMRYRHYSPKLLVESGLGQPEDDDGTWVPAEVRKMQEAMRAEREKRRALEKQREEEQRKEREKRREEAEARRRERMKEEKEREEKRREKEKQSKAAEKKDDSKATEKKSDGKSTEKKDASKATEKKNEGKTTEKKDDAKATEKEPQKEEKGIEEELVPKEESSTGGNEAQTVNAESPPAKKAKVEDTTPVQEDVEKEEAMEESDEGEEEGKDKKGTPKRGGKAKRGGRKKAKK